MSGIRMSNQNWHNSDLIANKEPSPSVGSNDEAATMPGQWPESEDCTSDHCIPTPNDVICGKDRMVISHVGNKCFRRMIEMNRVAYQTASSRRTKTEITRAIEDMIRGFGGRFLKLNEKTGRLEELSGTEAHEKTSHALRSAKDKSRTPRRQKRIVAKCNPTPVEEERFETALEFQKRKYELLLERKDDSPEAEDLKKSEDMIRDTIKKLK